MFFYSSFFFLLHSIFFPTKTAPWLSHSGILLGRSSRSRVHLCVTESLPQPPPNLPPSPRFQKGSAGPKLQLCHTFSRALGTNGKIPVQGAASPWSLVPDSGWGRIQPRRGPACPGEAPTSPHPSQRRCTCSPWRGANPNPIAGPVENTPERCPCLAPPKSQSPHAIPISFPTSRRPSYPPKPCANHPPGSQPSSRAAGFPHCEPERGRASPHCYSKPYGPPSEHPEGQAGMQGT